MKKLKMIGGVVVVLSAVAVLYMVRPMGAQQAEPETITITITPNADPAGPPSISPDPVSISRNQEVEWTCSNGCDFTVVFTQKTRKPFKGRIFNKANSKSGVPTGPHGKYKYSVIVGEGSVDPQIIVR
ncbi:MAG: hypothetical protein EPN47_02765 [Acidobacteria bacterium]|nr:MAG: hypothetical protein EPN47_02765 [Acidobacteriota bacterium]